MTQYTWVGKTRWLIQQELEVPSTTKDNSGDNSSQNGAYRLPKYPWQLRVLENEGWAAGSFTWRVTRGPLG